MNKNLLTSQWLNKNLTIKPKQKRKLLTLSDKKLKSTMRVNRLGLAEHIFLALKAILPQL